MVRDDGKSLKDLVEHLTVLCGDADLHRETAGMEAEITDQRGELDGFGPGAEYREDPDHLFSIDTQGRRQNSCTLS
jgi:hypothetical protein